MSESSISYTVNENQIAIATLDMPGSGANILSIGMIEELAKFQEQLQTEEGIRGLVLISAKPKIFVAGANLKEIHAALDWPDERIIEFANRGRTVYHAFGQFDFPSVAAIHGACVGGGLEIALGFDRRVATSDRRTIIGLPETNLGLIPGWAGTVRLPRMVGLAKAIELVVNGQNVPSPVAHELGIVDRIVEQHSDLLSAAIEIIEEESASQAYLKNRQDRIAAINASVEVSQHAEKITTSGFAQEVVKQHMLSSAEMDFESACQSEAAAFAKTWGSEECHGLLNNFFLGEHNRKSPGKVDLSVTPKEISKVAVIGAGLMGAGIAKACLKSGKSVLLFDTDQSRAKQLVASVENPKAEFQVGTDWEQLETCGLVIESIVEDFQAKTSLLGTIAGHLNSEAIVASNTSAIPISELGAALPFADRFCGIHFCNPDLMKLVEVVRNDTAAELTISSAVNFVRQLRKTPVVVQDAPGFVVNRILSSMLNEATRLLSWGHSIEEIDASVRSFGFAAGPFQIIDIIGADTCLHAGLIMGQRGVNCVNSSPIIPRLVKRGLLGQKSNAGFYDYQSDEVSINPDAMEILSGYLDERPAHADSQPSIEVQILFAMCHEAKTILSKEIVNDSRDIDICMIQGLSFPANKGGLMFWAEGFGDEALSGAKSWMCQVDSRFESTP